MAMFEWNPIYELGIDKIDCQHKKLFGLINELYQVMKDRKEAARLDTVFKELVEYFFHHFKIEEEIMQKYSYPNFTLHRQEHDSLTKNLLFFREKFKAGDVFIISELISFLKSWLTIHILQADMKFTKYFKTISQVQNKRGVQPNVC